MGRRFPKISLALFILLISLAPSVPNAVASTSSTLTVDPNPSTGNVGESLSVSVVAQNFQAINGFDIRVMYDGTPGVLEPTSLELSTDFEARGSDVFVLTRCVNGGTGCDFGTVRMAAVLLGSSTPDPFNGALFTIHFRVIGVGQTVLDIFDDELANPGKVGHATIDGVFINQADRPSFTLTASPAHLSLGATSEGTSLIALTSLDGFEGVVTLTGSVSVTEDSLAVSMEPLIILAPGETKTSNITIHLTSRTVPGQYRVEIRGDSGSTSQTATIFVLVAMPDFEFYESYPSMYSGTLSIYPGDSASDLVIVRSMTGFNGTIELSASSMIAGLSFSLDPPSVTISKTNRLSNSTFHVSTSTTTPTGSYSVTMVAKSGALSHTLMVTVRVNSRDFNLHFQSNIRTLTRGGCGRSTSITLEAASSPGEVTLSAASSPSGLRAIFSPETVSLTSPGTIISKLTVSAEASASPGTNELTITASSKFSSHSVSILVSVVDATFGRIHAPIYINGNNCFVGAEGVIGGTGIPSDPYLIEGWNIYSLTDSIHAIEISNTDASFVIQNVNIKTGEFDGIHLEAARKGIVANISITGEFETGISLKSSSDITIENSEFYENYAGIGITDSHDILVKENNITSAAWRGTFGISVQDSANSTIIGNQISSNYEGIQVNGAENLGIDQNTLRLNSMGIELSCYGTVCRNITITGNLIMSNTVGIHVLSCTTPQIDVYHNNFVQNQWQTQLIIPSDVCYPDDGDFSIHYDSFGSTIGSVWDGGYPEGGNYWSDYTGLDNCGGPQQDLCTSGDGIGDTAYNNDRYPLTTMFVSKVDGLLSFSRDSLALRSRGKYLTAYLEFPLEYYVSGVDQSTLRLNSTVAILDSTRAIVGDHDGNGIPDLTLKFNLREVSTLLSKPGYYTLQVTGDFLVGGRSFTAYARIRVVG